ncbi:DUF7287 family protein [Halovenus sp. HT40]|uniref:DUF7287 family protein n=1 Tax=Halovenus sp. HT40 TaxID=3126691 RepID=UPI00300E850F
MESQEMGTRGQTTLDFTIGISVFLGAIIFIFLFAPGILTPFTVTGQSETVTVDRTADYLAQDALGSPDEPYVLDRGCTVAFFDREADEDPATGAHDCRYDESALNEQVGIGEYQTVNVTLLGNLSDGTQLEQLYWDTSDRNLTTSSNSNTIELTIGGDIEQRRATTTATRVVTLHGRDVMMQVVVS